MTKGKGTPRYMGLIITEHIKRTPSEDVTDKGIVGHRFPGTPISYTLKPYAPPIRDQADCGSCVAFGSCGTLEITLKAAGGDATDRSEWDLFSNGGSCDRGWTLEAANAALISKGVCTEACWPYRGSRQPCSETTRIKIVSTNRITSDAAAKAAIASGHAIQFAMDVDSDYPDVDSEAVYEPTYGDYMGGHCQTIIGYDDTKAAWLVRNSWGSEWGFGGYAWVKYGVCGVFRAYCGYSYNVTSTPPVGQTGIQINTTGSLKADIYVNQELHDTGKDAFGNRTGIGQAYAGDGPLIGQTDGFVALKAGTYSATIKKAGYQDYPLMFTATDKQVYQTTITMAPIVPAGDLVLPSDGILLVMPILGQKTSSILIDEGGPVAIVSLGKLKFYRYNTIGDYKAGGLTVRLEDAKGIVSHNLIVKAAGKNLWMVWAKLKATGGYSHSFQFRLIPSTAGLEDMAMSAETFGSISIEEEN
jgi:hypothetical protein